MSDLVEKEGTPDRAADRGRDELCISDSALPSLGDPVVVTKLVNDFVTLVIGIRGRFIKDEISGEQSIADIRRAAKAYGDIVMGRDANYAALPWNDPRRLGRRIELVVTPEKEITDPGELLFVELASSVCAMGDASASDRLSDADGEAKMGIMINDVIGLIMGWR